MFKSRLLSGLASIMAMILPRNMSIMPGKKTLPSLRARPPVMLYEGRGNRSKYMPHEGKKQQAKIDRRLAAGRNLGAPIEVRQ